MTLRSPNGKFVAGPGGPTASTLKRRAQKAARKARLGGLKSGRVSVSSPPAMKNIPTYDRARQAVGAPVTQLVNPTAQPQVEPSKPRLINRIAVVVDRSGSMWWCYDKAANYANQQLATIKNKATETGQETTVSLMTFADPGTEVFLARNAHFQAAPLVTDGDMRHGRDGSTALNDAVYHAALDLSAKFNPPGTDVSYLVVTLTDGGENSSTSYPYAHGLERVLKQFDPARFTFVFLCPPGAKRTLVNNGVPEGNIMEWEQTREGLDRATKGVSAGLGSYYLSTRASGQGMTTSFFTDLSQVTPGDLARLENVTSLYKSVPVPAEVDIKPFVEGATRRPYVPGNAFYELTKKEKVQAHKAVIIRDRKTGVLYGGPEAKKLVGIAGGAGVTCLVTPGNHANYRIYVSSTSTNRKLVRGTDVLIKREGF